MKKYQFTLDENRLVPMLSKEFQGQLGQGEVLLYTPTSVRSDLTCNASEQSTIGTSATNVEIIRNVICVKDKQV